MNHRGELLGFSTAAVGLVVLVAAGCGSNWCIDVPARQGHWEEGNASTGFPEPYL